jgi:hypothetical protein
MKTGSLAPGEIEVLGIRTTFGTFMGSMLIVNIIFWVFVFLAWKWRAWWLRVPFAVGATLFGALALLMGALFFLMLIAPP